MARRFTSFVSYQAAVEVAIRKIGCSMVTAVAIQITNDAKLEARGGFKSGDFVTRGWQGIRWQVKCDGLTPVGRVGHHELHFMLWEMGHHNAWTRKYERNPWLSNGFKRNPATQDAVSKVAARVEATKHSVLPRRLL